MFELSYDPEKVGRFSCRISLNGDPRQVVVRDAVTPVSLPEIYLLKSIHGAAAVNDIVCEDITETSRGALRDEMVQRYGKRALHFLSSFSMSTAPLVSDKFDTRDDVDELRLAADQIKAKKAAQKKVAKKPVKEDPGKEDPVEELPDLRT